jgi:hypothetical protein
LIKGGLDILFRDDPNVFVAGDLFWYPVEGDNKTRLAPDTMVALGRPKGHRGSYMQWREEGIAPQVVFEVLSPGNRAGELARKFQFYEHFGVQEYYIYDPDDNTLEGWLRDGEALRKIPEMNGWISPRLGIRFSFVDDQLHLFGPDGKPFVSNLELARRVTDQDQQIDEQRHQIDEQRHQIDEQRHQIDEQRHQIDEQHKRAERLAAQLRALGIEPEG